MEKLSPVHYGIIIDCWGNLADAVKFWSATLNLGVKIHDENNEGRYAVLQDSIGTEFVGGITVEIQIVSPVRINMAALNDYTSSHLEKLPGVHIDIQAKDVDARAIELEKIGAKKLQRHDRGWWIMLAPTGQKFCVIPIPETWNERLMTQRKTRFQWERAKVKAGPEVQNLKAGCKSLAQTLLFSRVASEPGKERRDFRGNSQKQTHLQEIQERTVFLSYELERLHLCYRKNKTWQDLRHMIDRALKRGFGKVENEIGWLEFYLEYIFKTDRDAYAKAQEK